ncbi:glucokinase [Coralloluteibacterium stylophorae]|uniref:Glucokinase n=1 Tax=Coralloluteibacterium stylophorae TaxID=1776034 RepID=A0A8J7VWN0_9GAMM|nr:glucokinase [Coralloluteibacterium stylophorae]
MSDVLLADIGGTNARFALADDSAVNPLVDGSMRRYDTADFPSLAEAARHYLGEIGADPSRGVFAAAGPVVGDSIRMTNCPWVISFSQTRQALDFARLHVVNDFHAMARCVPLLEDADVEPVGGVAQAHIELGESNHNCAVLGPGTGLGVGGLILREGRAFALETEGGHVSFAPVDELEIDILRRLVARFGRVSTERLICGSGLVVLHQTLAEIEGHAPEDLEPKDVTARAEAGDAAALRTIEVFCAIFGSVAGDVALMLGAWDGVYLTGGLVPRLMWCLRDGRFRERFEAKGRFAEVLAATPTVAILHPQPGLLGLAAIALDERRHVAPGALS